MDAKRMKKQRQYGLASTSATNPTGGKGLLISTAFGVGNGAGLRVSFREIK